MKRNLLIIATILFPVITLVLGNYFERMYQREKIASAKIHIYPMEKTFIEPDEVAGLIQLNDSLNQHVQIDEIERKLEENDYIENAEVYKDLNGHLVADVEQYKPIARFMGNRSFYIDKDGKRKPLSKHYTERVMLVFGELNPADSEGVIDLIQQIYKDKFLNNEIAEIHLKNNRKAVLKATGKPGDFILDITKENIENQLFKLKTMLLYLQEEKAAKNYKIYDFRYKNQVVCK